MQVRPIEGLQQFDEPNALTKALGEEGFRKWAAKRATMIVGSRAYVMQSRPELSLAPDPNYAPKLAIVVRQSLTPGRRLDYESYVKTDILPIVKKINTKGDGFEFGNEYLQRYAFISRRLSPWGDTRPGAL